MYKTGRSYRRERLIDLEQTVNSLNGQLRMMQRDLDRAKPEPFPIRLWRNLANLTGGREFMSAVCNRYARPNTKMVTHVDSRA
jgi:hypothetical protein